MIKQIEIMQQELVSDEELDKAKNSYLNSFVFNFDSKSKILGRFGQFIQMEIILITYGGNNAHMR